MDTFISFLLQRVYKSKPIPNKVVEIALNNTIKDVKYHFPALENDDIIQRIKLNNNELAVFLFRLGRELHLSKLETLKIQIHSLLKELLLVKFILTIILMLDFILFMVKA